MQPELMIMAALMLHSSRGNARYSMFGRIPISFRSDLRPENRRLNLAKESPAVDQSTSRTWLGTPSVSIMRVVSRWIIEILLSRTVGSV